MSSKRSHIKSRLGCKQCKSRRIKCDENPPRCGNCTKKGLECDYQGWESALNNIQFFNPPAMSQRASRSTSDGPPEPTESPAASVAPQTFSLDDMGLLCHFILHTSQTMDFGGESTIQIWQREVPQIAKSHAFLMHALLAFAAVHQAKTEEGQAVQGLKLAHHHYGQALTLFRQSVGEVSAEQADVLLSFGILTNFLTANLGFDGSADERDPISDFAKFCGMLHNSVGMLVPIRHSLRGTAVASEMRAAFEALIPHDIPLDASRSLDRLTELALLRYPDLAAGSGEAFIVNDTLVKLREFYTFVDPHPSTLDCILRWPIRLDPEFSLLLQKRNPIVIGILAHWCVPYCNAPARWYFSERPRSLMSAIGQELRGSDWEEGIRWPLSVTIGEIQP